MRVFIGDTIFIAVPDLRNPAEHKHIVPTAAIAPISISTFCRYKFSRYTTVDFSRLYAGCIIHFK